ncbi:MAG: large-conductance mechanosensitive channel protein MscL [Clostridium sp.]|nr:large-conductance mechanosensitive channel protein MscL [Clostridium sp.]
MKQFFKDFKEFATRGNVVDMAVGVVVGTAFSKIVSSLVSDIIMPALSLITGRVSLQNLSFTLPTGEGMEPIVLKYGVFLQSVLDFLIIAFSIFVVIKLIGKLHRKKKVETPAAPPAPTKEEVLLTEIRDLLTAQKASTTDNEKEADNIPALESDKKDS